MANVHIIHISNFNCNIYIIYIILRIMSYSIHILTMLSRMLSYTLPLSKYFHKKYLDLHESANIMKDTLNILLEYRANVSIEFTEMYRSAENMASSSSAYRSIKIHCCHHEFSLSLPVVCDVQICVFFYISCLGQQRSSSGS